MALHLSGQLLVQRQITRDFSVATAYVGSLHSIQLVKSIMQASYNRLQITAEKRMGHRFGVKSFYKFSKSINDVQLQNNTVNGGAQEFNNLVEDRPRSDFDRHNFVTSFIWQPDYSTAKAILCAESSRWMLSAVVSIRSGVPFTVTTGKDTNLDDNNNDLANLVGDPHLDPHRSTAAVTAPPTRCVRSSWECA